MRLVFIRHGQTPSNILIRYNGQMDEDINETGIKQAEELAKTLEDVKFDKIYASPLLRAKHTCQIVNKNNQKVIYDDRLKERTLGKLDGTDIGKSDYNVAMHLNYYYDHKKEDIENLKDFFARVHSFIDDVIEENGKDDTILIATHGGVMRAAYFYFEELPEDGDVSFFKAQNCEINVYDIIK